MNELVLMHFVVISNQKHIRLVADRNESNFKVIISEENTNKILPYDKYKDAEAAMYRTLCREFSDLYIEKNPDLPRSMEL